MRFLFPVLLPLGSVVVVADTGTDDAGTITALRFVPSRNMLLAASTDSTISLYRVRDWVLLRGLKGHKGRVNSVDAHPDGRVALSVGVDRMLRMWDLVAGKSVTALKLGVGASPFPLLLHPCGPLTSISLAEGDLVRWNTNGSKFAVICNNALTVYGLVRPPLLPPPLLLSR